MSTKIKGLTLSEMTDKQVADVTEELGLEGLKFEIDPNLEILEDNEQQPTSRCLPDHQKGSSEYAGPAVIKTCIGPVACTLYYLFDAEELEAAGEDESNLPWDVEHLTHGEIAE